MSSLATPAAAASAGAGASASALPTAGAVSVSINGCGVPVTGAAGVDIARATACVPFKDWVARVHPSLSVSSVHITDVDYFGPRVGFVKFRADVRKDGVALPGVVFMRGGAVAILPVLLCGAERFVVCCRQPRIPIGSADYLEIPAGMLDGEGNFTGVAAKEMREETGIEIGAHELVDLTAAAFGPGGASGARGIYPSVGGCDEFLRIMYVARECTPSDLNALRGRATGNLAEGETITLDILPLDSLWRVCSDAKTLAGLYLLDKLQAQGLVMAGPTGPPLSTASG